MDPVSPFKVGQKLRKFFGASVSNPRPAWYFGTIQAIDGSGVNALYRVVYEDGDAEDLTDQELL
jgi:hypothetical protein